MVGGEAATLPHLLAALARQCLRPAEVIVVDDHSEDATGPTPVETLDPRSPGKLLLETRRAERVHGLLLPAGLLTTLWWPTARVVVNGIFALAFNLPWLLLLRHNRARLRRCLSRLG